MRGRFPINDQRSTINDQRSTINDQRSTITAAPAGISIDTAAA
ncbi:MAG TPA: hypothetical protein VLV48_08980 [Thermoanaerobaculia bacterium]|nr:hypothetical protein [Thermoanaerobaculia bacterium]